MDAAVEIVELQSTLGAVVAARRPGRSFRTRGALGGLRPQENCSVQIAARKHGLQLRPAEENCVRRQTTSP